MPEGPRANNYGGDGALTLNRVQVCFPPCLSRSMAHRHSRFSCFHAEPIRCLSEVPSTMMGEMYRSLFSCPGSHGFCPDGPRHQGRPLRDQFRMFLGLSSTF